jgi:5-(carboxyamino)imidazole ribonucleotide synthase
MKTAAWGYDGKGQVVVRSRGDAESSWQKLGSQPAILERFVEFDCELSVVAARGLDGQFVAYPPVMNVHRNHILDVSMAPAVVNPKIASTAIELAREVLEQLEVVGVLCVEFFVTGDGQLLINELAPRPHNSGHLTIDANSSSQFEQQVRAVCGLPLGSPRQHRPAAMANLLGELWAEGEPDWATALGEPDVKLHLYGKKKPRAGRKMGHVTALADSVAAAAELARHARHSLGRPIRRRPSADSRPSCIADVGIDSVSVAQALGPG